MKCKYDTLYYNLKYLEVFFFFFFFLTKKYYLFKKGFNAHK